VIAKALWAFRSLVFNAEAMKALKDVFSMEIMSLVRDDSASLNVMQDGSVHFSMTFGMKEPRPLAVSHWSRFFEYPWAWIEGDLKGHHTILDAGGGLSPFQLLAATVCKAVVNVDAARREVVEKAGLAYAFKAARNLSVEYGDIRKLLYTDGSFDRVFCISVLEHLDRPEEVLNELLRVLRPGGHLLLTMDVTEGGDGFSHAQADALLRGYIGQLPPKPQDAILVRVNDALPPMFVLCVKMTK
jgi:SAM-dependent methyltransferase